MKTLLKAISDIWDFSQRYIQSIFSRLSINIGHIPIWTNGKDVPFTSIEALWHQLVASQCLLSFPKEHSPQHEQQEMPFSAEENTPNAQAWVNTSCMWSIMNRNCLHLVIILMEGSNVLTYSPPKAFSYGCQLHENSSRFMSFKAYSANVGIDFIEETPYRSKLLAKAST